MLRPDQSEGAGRCGNSIQGRGTASREALGWAWPGVRQEQRGVEGGGGRLGAAGWGRTRAYLVRRESGMQAFFSQENAFNF